MASLDGGARSGHSLRRFCFCDRATATSAQETCGVAGVQGVAGIADHTSAPFFGKMVGVRGDMGSSSIAVGSSIITAALPLTLVDGSADMRGVVGLRGVPQRIYAGRPRS
mmetsp:Transcript_31705/g.66451  ORF Transcript_31705/g.66451 Transcript_31705/m.66451 type:complete len:110 (+) Transcript_31705:542-871(+)